MITILITYNYIHGQHMVPSIKSIENQTIPESTLKDKTNPMLYRTNR